MGKQFTLTTADQHQLGAYRADAKGTVKGGIVVVQEIFGVNSHIRSVCDRFAEQGYNAVAPAVFDRFVRDFECGYSPDEIANARKYLGNLNWDHMMHDVASAVDDLKGSGPIGVCGFCMGGTAAFLAATRLDGLSASLCYYGGAIVKFADEQPKIPVQMHFGETDASIPLTDVEIIRQKRPDCEIYVYEGAGHGFHCDARASYDAESAKIAWERSMAFLGKHMKK